MLIESFKMGRAACEARLIIVIGSLEQGGCETHLLQVLPLLSRRGYDVRVFLLSSVGALGNDMERAGVRLIRPWIEVSDRRKNFPIFRIIRLLLISVQFLCFSLRFRPRSFFPTG